MDPPRNTIPSIKGPVILELLKFAHHACKDLYSCVHTYMCICMYIDIERASERERESSGIGCRVYQHGALSVVGLPKLDNPKGPCTQTVYTLALSSPYEGTLRPNYIRLASTGP